MFSSISIYLEAIQLLWGKELGVWLNFNVNSGSGTNTVTLGKILVFSWLGVSSLVKPERIVRD